MKGNYESVMDLAREVQRIENAKQDYIVPGYQLAMRNDNILAIGENRQGIGEVAHGQISDKLGIPKRYYDRMGDIPELRTQNVNAWLDREKRNFMVRTLDGKARALLSDRFKPIDNSTVLGGVVSTLEGKELAVKSVSLTERKMFLQVVFPAMTRDVAVGDAVQYGLTISNSEVGSGSVDVSSMIWRLVCSNGMVASSVVNSRHVGRQASAGEDYSIFSDEAVRADMQAFKLKLRDTVQAAISDQHFDAIVDQMRAATEDRITRPEQTVRNVTKRFDLSEDFGDLILGNMIEEGNLNRWGVVNGITALAKNIESPDRQFEIERLGHSVLTLAPSEWSVIAA